MSPVNLGAILGGRSIGSAPTGQPGDTLVKVFTIITVIFTIIGGLLVIVTIAPLLLGGAFLGSFGGDSSIFSGAMFLGVVAILIGMAPVILILVVVPG